ncbi:MULTISPECIES: hypothetical protein [unclassified Methylobacterium]|uniref:hypothetical protein n=1 Tax=unclassified Methylobacterium TaxID=2615210 RepID=UPI00226A0498|nr:MULTISPECIES: hypothetical protein [unclassified Methylobacterium]
MASAVFGDLFHTVDCLAKRDGNQAAFVELADASRLPDWFLLIAMSIQVRHRCEVVERGEDFVRVQFIGE